MKYFVTGATGFIGGRVARQLLAAGHEVITHFGIPWARVEKSRDGVALRDEFFFCTHPSPITRFPAHFLLQLRPTEEHD